MIQQGCARAEILAGAVALGEATEVEREEYRRHISACGACLRELGGEREIERVMSVVDDARASETWEPVGSPLSRSRRSSFVPALKYGGSVIASALALSFALHLVVAASFRTSSTPPETDIAALGQITHVTLDRRQAETAPKRDEPRLVVVHNVITLRAPNAGRGSADSVVPKPAEVKQSTTVVAATQIAESPRQQAQTQSFQQRRPSLLPARRRDAATPTIVAESAPPIEAHAESIAMAPSYSSRDVVPIGGETAINPQPAAIAYSEGAEGTSVFEVSVDDRGVPAKCTITKSSGFVVLDEAVCRAAMKAKDAPRIVGGRPASGVYRDAFTFRATSNNEGIDRPQI